MLLTDVQRHVDASGIAGEAREERDEEAAKKGDAEGGELDVPVRVGISRHAARGRNKNSAPDADHPARWMRFSAHRPWM